MPWFEVSADVCRADLHLAGSGLRGRVLHSTPSFCVQAEDEAQAYATAVAIVDPAAMTGVDSISLRPLNAKKRK